jgi:hypothetical protein
LRRASREGEWVTVKEAIDVRLQARRDEVASDTAVLSSEQGAEWKTVKEERKEA